MCVGGGAGGRWGGGGSVPGQIGVCVCVCVCVCRLGMEVVSGGKGRWRKVNIQFLFNVISPT